MRMTGKAFVCVVGLFVAEPLSAQVGPQGSNVVEVGLALRQVDGVKRVLMIGAHPDDEDSSLLATLARGMGVETAYLSPTWSPSSGRSRRWPPSDAPTPMHIKFLARGTGSAREAADYLLGARDATGQLREGVEVLQGDPHRVAAVADALAFEHKYTSGVIAWAPDDTDAVTRLVREHHNPYQSPSTPYRATLAAEVT